jgi:hypothetical protein
MSVPHDEKNTATVLGGHFSHCAKPVEPSELIATIASIAGRTDFSAD